MKRMSGRLAGSLVAMLSLSVLCWIAWSPASADDTKKDAKAETKSTDTKKEDSKKDESKKEPKSAGPIKLPEAVYSAGYTGSYEELIGFINAQVREGWTANEVQPSDPADDGEWLRRVHLDIVGHIP